MGRGGRWLIGKLSIEVEERSSFVKDRVIEWCATCKDQPDEVIRWLKGSGPEVLEVGVGATGSVPLSNALYVEAGETWRIFAREEAGTLEARRCNGSHRFIDSAPLPPLHLYVAAHIWLALLAGMTIGVGIALVRIRQRSPAGQILYPGPADRNMINTASRGRPWAGLPYC